MNQSLLENIIFLWKYLGKTRKLQFLSLIILMIISMFADIISIGAVIPFLSALTNPDKLMEVTWFQPIIRVLNIQTADELLFPLTIGFIGVSIFATGIRIILLWLNMRLSAAMGTQLRTDIYARALYQPYADLISNNSSHLISIVSEKIGITISVAITQVLMFISALLTSIAITITLIWINPMVAILASIILGGGYILIGYFFRQKIKYNGDLIAQNQPVAVRCMQEGLGGIRDIIINNSQDVFIQMYNKVAQVTQVAASTNGFLSNVPKSLLEMLSISLIAGLAYYLQSESSQPDEILATLGALALGAQRLLPALQQIYFSWSHIHGNQAILQEVVQELRQPLPVNRNSKNIPLNYKKEIKLKNVNFHYRESKKLVLQNINLKILKGSRVGFIGETGSGKSTLLDILMGLIAPIDGVFMVDDTIINTNNLKNWQQNIAHVPQNIFLSDSSMAENIAFGIPFDEIDIKKVKEAAKKAYIDTFIETLPEGYKTSVGERGVKLSGGQRQRIGIARALYKQASVIIFDEATSALDDTTETNVIKAINSLDKELTILMVAHRLSTLKGCDIIYKLDKGKIIESGMYEEIIK